MCVAASLDVHRERRRVAAQALRADAELVDRRRQLPPRASRLPASAQRLPSGRVAATLARCTHRSAVPPTPTPTIVGGQVLPPASSTQSTTKVLIASTPSAGIAILQPRVVLRAAALRDHLDRQRLRLRRRNRCGSPARAMPHDVCSFLRVIGCTTDERSGCSRVARSQPRTIACFSAIAVDLDAAADRHVVDRDAGVLAQQVVVLLGDRDVADHRAEDALPVRVGLGRIEALEALP